MHLADKISDAELSVMKLLWKEAKPITYTQIRTELQSTTDWEPATINTLLRRLVQKGAVYADKQKVTLFSALVSEENYSEAQEKRLLDKLYNGSAKSLVAGLLQRGKLTEADLNELQQYFHVDNEN